LKPILRAKSTTGAYRRFGAQARDERLLAFAILMLIGPNARNRAWEDTSARSRSLIEHQDRLNRINAFPVPDGDTGTNLAAIPRDARVILLQAQ
jgi:hypothetical protein